MKEWLFIRLLVMLSYCLRKIIKLFSFFLGIVIHPIKNISIWMILLLTLGNVPIHLKGQSMFLMSARVKSHSIIKSANKFLILREQILSLISWTSKSRLWSKVKRAE